MVDHVIPYVIISLFLSDMLIIITIDISVKRTIMNVSHTSSSLRNKNIYIIQANHLQFSEISRKAILELQTPLKKSLIVLAVFLKERTGIVTTIIIMVSSNTQISSNMGVGR